MANLIDKKDLKKVFWRSQICQFSHNYERMQSLSTVYILKPIFKKLYKSKSKEPIQLLVIMGITVLITLLLWIMLVLIF